jgi:hypothetical protein
VEAAFAVVRDVGPLWLVAMWLGSVRWTHVDARARLANPAGICAATWLALGLPFVGAAVWAALRPVETRLERRERRVVQLLLEAHIDPSEAAAVAEPRTEGSPAVPTEAAA